MTPWTCVGCRTTYRLRLQRCPRCHGTQFVEEGQQRMALQVCVDCTTKYSVGAERCPHCGSTAHHEEGEEMPKITQHGGPSNADAELANDEQPAEAPDSVELAAELSGDSEPLPDAVEGDTTEHDAPGIKRPLVSAVKADWVEFAKAINTHLQTQDSDPELLTKAQLIERYGEYGED